MSTFKSVVVIGAELGASFRAAFGEAKSDTKELGAALKEIGQKQAGIKGTARVTEELADAQKNLRTEMEKLAEVRRNQKTLEAKGFDKNQFGMGEAFDKQKIKVDAARKAVEKKDAALQKYREEARKAGINVDNLSDEMERLAREADAARKKAEKMAHLKELGTKVGSAWNGVTASFRRASIAAAGVTAAVTGVFMFMKSVADANDDAADFADSLGMSVQALQAMRYAAADAGLNGEKFDTLLQTMVKNLADAANGSGEAQKAIRGLGLDAKALSLMSPDMAMEVLADAMMNVKDASTRTSYAVDIFGRQGVRMNAVLAKGSAGLRAMRKEAIEMGAVLDKDGAKKVDEFDRAQRRLGAGFQAIKNQLAVQLMPVFAEFMDELRVFLREHKEDIISFGKELGAALKEALPAMLKIGTALAVMAYGLFKVADLVASAVGGWDNLTYIVGAFFAADFAYKAYTFATSVYSLASASGVLANVLPLVGGGIRAMSAAIMANPIGLIIGLIALLAYTIYSNWSDIKEFFKTLWDEPMDTMMDFARFCANFAAYYGPLAPLFRGLDWIGSKIEWIGDAWGWFKEQIGIDHPDKFQPSGTETTTLRGSNAAASSALALNNLPPMASQVGGARTVNAPVSVTVNGAPGQDPSSIADEVMRRMNEQQSALSRGALYD